MIKYKWVIFGKSMALAWVLHFHKIDATIVLSMIWQKHILKEPAIILVVWIHMAKVVITVIIDVNIAQVFYPRIV